MNNTIISYIQEIIWETPFFNIDPAHVGLTVMPAFGEGGDQKRLWRAANGKHQYGSHGYYQNNGIVIRYLPADKAQNRDFDTAQIQVNIGTLLHKDNKRLVNLVQMPKVLALVQKELRSRVGLRCDLELECISMLNIQGRLKFLHKIGMFAGYVSQLDIPGFGKGKIAANGVIWGTELQSISIVAADGCPYCDYTLDDYEYCAECHMDTDDWRVNYCLKTPLSVEQHLGTCNVSCIKQTMLDKAFAAAFSPLLSVCSPEEVFDLKHACFQKAVEKMLHAAN